MIKFIKINKIKIKNKIYRYRSKTTMFNLKLRICVVTFYNCVLIATRKGTVSEELKFSAKFASG